MVSFFIGIFLNVPASPLLAEQRQNNGCPVESGLSPKQWICFTLREAQEIDSKLIDLEALLVAERAKKPRRLGFSIACSAGVGVGLSGDFGLIPPSCGIFYGVTFTMGR